MAPLGSQFSVGDKVFGLSDTFIRGEYGSYAEYLAVPEKFVARMPEGMRFDEAASLPLVSLTAMQALDVAQASPGLRILIHGGEGGVGLSAIQLAKNRRLKVSATASAETLELLMDRGADQVIDYKSTRFEDVCERPVDIVLDGVGGECESRSLQLLARTGHFISLLAKPDYFLVISGMLKSWLRLGPRYHVVSVKPSGIQTKAIADLWKEKRLKTHVQRVVPFDEVVEAHRIQESGHSHGKIVLRIAQEG